MDRGRDASGCQRRIVQMRLDIAANLLASRYGDRGLLSPRAGE